MLASGAVQIASNELFVLDCAFSLTTSEVLFSGIDDADKRIISEERPRGQTSNPTPINSRVVHGRILGGTQTQDRYVVYVIGTPSLSTDPTIYCAGAILSDTWVLTAAQCVATAVSVNVSSNNLNTKTQATAYIHPSFIRNFVLHDIALLKLFQPLTVGISTIKLSATNTQLLDNVAVRTFGYGLENTFLGTTIETPTLKYVDMTVLNKKTCQEETLETNVAYPGNTGCLVTSVGSKGFCFGDAGGPVVYKGSKDNAAKLIGINSQYVDCPSIYPSSFTFVYPYLNWIKLITKMTFT
ncbi:Hypothetical predicted protein [Cloeon dipterum]|uniref:Peptidase S1 domain-containing protein n=1 Tax=Cloeon dipterum TaxID=197152 RepID=A0A8S1BPV7_9INSE|nr:Hypothetical predicted protein [Cloeon dipterum]